MGVIEWERGAVISAGWGDVFDKQHGLLAGGDFIGEVFHGFLVG
jgi:hypothetical protein